MKSLNEDIGKNEYKQIYLLYGEEDYLKKLYKNKLHRGMVPEGDTMNYSYYEGKGINPNEIIDLSETMPFFADRRLIIIENSGFFKGQVPQLSEYLEELPGTSYFVFIESEIDKRSKLFKTVKANGRIVEFGAQDDATLTKWILGLLKKENKSITQASMHLLLSGTGSEMDNIEKEVEKLLCYTMGRDVITDEDIKEVCTVRTTNKIFDMINAIAEKNQKKALDLYYDLLALKEPPMRILFLIARQFNLLMQVKNLSGLGFDQNSIAKKVSLPGFAIRNYSSQARRFTADILKEAVTDCVNSEEAVKTGRLNDVMSVELLIVKYSS